ncbi:endonuclease III, partial [Vibrio parahaemolyticus VPTS-2010_2]
LVNSSWSLHLFSKKTSLWKLHY